MNNSAYISKDGKSIEVVFNNESKEFKVGDKVRFLRQAVGYETKYLNGTIIQFGHSVQSNGQILAGIKAAAEYGEGLPYNHEVNVFGIEKI